MHNSLYNYISKYYGEQLTYRGENYSIPEFITRLSEETADVFIHEMHQCETAGFELKYLYGIYDVRVDEDDKCEISVIIQTILHISVLLICIMRWLLFQLNHAFRILM